MGQALYRKYRSRSFDELVGQTHVTRTLANALGQGKVSHAYLFTGPRGVGKTSIARILAHAINELEYSDKPHLDIIEIDAASNRRIEDVRDLREKVHIAPVSAKYKVYIIDEVHMLTSESFNALLKTLEEPPSHVVFILATTELHKLPATITSRTQRFAFAPPSSEMIAAHLKTLAEQENIQISPEAIELLADHADGSFRDSISLLDQVSSTVAENVIISEEDVANLLGLPPKSGLTTLFESILAHNPSETAANLRQLQDAGAAPATIATGLMRLATAKAADSPTVTGLLDKLIDVMRSPYPSAKLLAVTLEAAHQGTIAQTPGKAKTLTLQAVAPAIVASQQLKPAAKKSPQPEAIAPEAEKKPAAPPKKVAAASFDIQLVIDRWGDAMAALKLHSPPLFGAVKNAEVRQGSEAGALLLAFKQRLYCKRIEDPKHKTAFIKALQDTTGISEIILETVVDAGAEPTPLNRQSPEDTSVASAVIDVMGGGKMIQYSE